MTAFLFNDGAQAHCLSPISCSRTQGLQSLWSGLMTTLVLSLRVRLYSALAVKVAPFSLSLLTSAVAADEHDLGRS